MKKILFMLLLTGSLTILFFSSTIQAQQAYTTSQRLKTFPLQINGSKTVHLIFPAAVKYIDLGSDQLLAGKADGAENVVRVRAKPGTSKTFQESSLSVITADGKLFTFLVSYSEKLEVLSLNLAPEDFSGTTIKPAPQLEKPQVALSGTLLNSSQLAYYSRQVAAKKGKLKKQLRGEISLKLGRPCIREGVIFIPFQLANHSKISYDIELVRWYVKDAALLKHSASQEQDLVPVYTYNSQVQSVAAGKRVLQVFAFEKFTLPEGKVLVLEVFEKSGGRHFQIVIPGEKLLQATRPL